jgi:AcrR family transcriptional regulator
MSDARAYGGMAADERQAERRRRLMDAAYTVLADEGPAALTVTGVCRAARLTARYFYEHFENREALVAAIVSAETDAVIAATQAAAVAAGADPRSQIEAAIGAMLATTDADPRRLRMAREHDELVMRMRKVVADRMLARVVEHAEQQWPDASRDPRRLRLAASLAVGGVLQLVADWADDVAGLEREDVVRIGARFAVQTGQAVLADA